MNEKHGVNPGALKGSQDLRVPGVVFTQVNHQRMRERFWNLCAEYPICLPGYVGHVAFKYDLHGRSTARASKNPTAVP